MHRSRARFDPERSFGAWARRIAVNVAIDHLKRRRVGSPNDARRRRPGGRRSHENGDAAESLDRAFGTLPPVLRVTATLALVDERSTEIAETLGISTAPKRRVFRAICLLRAELTRLGWQR